MRILRKITLGIFLFLSLSFISVGYASISRNLQISGTVNYTAPSGVYIWKAEPKNSADATVNSYTGTNLDSTVRLSNTDGADTEEITLTFYNNSASTYIYDKTTYESDAYSNASIISDTKDAFPIIEPRGFLELTVSFSYSGGTVAASNELTSLLNFGFTLSTGSTAIKVTEGNSSDNPYSIHDGSILFGDTSKRWTSWAPNNQGRGDVTTLDVAFLEEVRFDMLELYHFVDAEGCDFPDSVSISYYDEELGEFLPLEVTETKYYRNEKHTVSYGHVVYSMEIDNDKNGTYTSITIRDGYRGEMPMTEFAAASPVTTRMLRLTLDGKDAAGSYNSKGYYVGITELMLCLDGNEVSFTNE